MLLTNKRNSREVQNGKFNDLFAQYTTSQAVSGIAHIIDDDDVMFSFKSTLSNHFQGSTHIIIIYYFIIFIVSLLFCVSP
mmetsp:Transcript_24795/g.39249  ORF Transcript_24795/g.39249 Transcript_24795/m.39249 type:complete len:80 (+) Transcript_24795:57-296(+)